jgi:RimJ/RimL family protein N-acetyltransferase
MFHVSALELITRQVSAWYVCDRNGRLLYIREPGYDESELDPAPRFWMGRTREGNIWRFRHDLPDNLVHDLENLCRCEPLAADFSEHPLVGREIRAILNDHAPVKREEHGPTDWIPEGTQTFQRDARLLTEANAQCLEKYFPWKQATLSDGNLGPLTMVVDEENAVSICYCARITGEVAEAGVETVAAARGKGFASAAVAAWAAAVRQCGLIPLYSTSWTNPASLGVACKLGMVRYGDDWSVH